MFKFIKELFQKIKIIFSTSFEKFKKYSAISVQVVDILKKVVESPITEMVVDLTPINGDDILLARLKQIVPRIAHETAVVNGILKVEDSNSDAVGALIKYLRELSPKARVSFWVMLSGEINEALSDGEMSLSEAIALAQLVYAEKIKA